MKAVQIAILILGTLCIVIGANDFKGSTPLDLEGCLQAEVEKITYTNVCGVKPPCLKLSIMKPYLQHMTADHGCFARSTKPFSRTEKMIVGKPVRNDPVVGDDKQKKPSQSMAEHALNHSRDSVAH